MSGGVGGVEGPSGAEFMGQSGDTPAQILSQVCLEVGPLGVQSYTVQTTPASDVSKIANNVMAQLQSIKGDLKAILPPGIFQNIYGTDGATAMSSLELAAENGSVAPFNLVCTYLQTVQNSSALLDGKAVTSLGVFILAGIYSAVQSQSILPQVLESQIAAVNRNFQANSDPSFQPIAQEVSTALDYVQNNYSSNPTLCATILNADIQDVHSYLGV